MNQKTGGQPKVWVIQPMIGEKSTVAKYCAELKIALAMPRSAVGNQAATMRAFAGKDGDSATPSRNRSTNSVTSATPGTNQPTQPCNKVNTDHSVILHQ